MKDGVVWLRRKPNSSGTLEPYHLDLMKIDNMSLEGRGREKSQETNVKSEQNHNPY